MQRWFSAAGVGRVASQVTDAIEVIAPDPDGLQSKLLITAEHASMRLPSKYKWPKSDERLVGTHWSFDLGSEEFARELTAATNSYCLLSRYSRLLCDPNRPLTSPTLYRMEAEKAPVLLNTYATNADLLERTRLYYEPYHEMLQTLAELKQIRLVLSIHSYTPNYEGLKRDVEIGVLHTIDPTLATKIQSVFKAAGYDARLNEPWSGKDGFMYAADSVRTPPDAKEPRRQAVMLEFRNDMCSDEAWRTGVMAHLVKVLAKEDLL